MLNISETYTRKKQILYDSKGVPIVKFKEKTPDRNDFTPNMIQNINNYIRCYPERVEIIEQKTNNQLTFF